jgi:hypothetical protein
LFHPRHGGEDDDRQANQFNEHCCKHRMTSAPICKDSL